MGRLESKPCWLTACVLVALAVTAAAETPEEARKRQLEALRAKILGRPVEGAVPAAPAGGANAPAPAPLGPPRRPVDPSDADGTFTYVAAVLETVMPGLVTVIAQRGGMGSTSGTGFCVGEGGLIVTARQTIALKSLSGVRLAAPGQEPVGADVLLDDKSTCLAVLRPRKPLAGVRRLRGVELAGITAGRPVFALALPAAPHVAIHGGKVKEIYDGQALPKALPDLFPTPHPYGYIETDAPINYATAGGLLVDEAGVAIGICALKVADSGMSFAVSWRAAEALAERADAARTVDLETIRAAATRTPWQPYVGRPPTSAKINPIVTRNKGVMFCPKCGGRAFHYIKKRVRRTASSTTLRLSPGRSTKHSTPVTVWKTITEKVNCGTCRQRRINPSVRTAYAGLCEVIEPMMALDRNCYRASASRQAASDVLDRAAFNDLAYGGQINSAARSSLSGPAVAVGKPMYFMARISASRRVGETTVLLAHPYRSGHPIVAVTRAKDPPGPEGYCYIAGVISAAVGSVPCLTAAGVYRPHQANPAYRPKRPAGSVATRTPSTKPAGSTVDPSEPASRLRTARMYISGGLKDKGISLLREIVKKHPKTEAATEAELLLIELGQSK